MASEWDQYLVKDDHDWEQYAIPGGDQSAPPPEYQSNFAPGSAGGYAGSAASGAARGLAGTGDLITSLLTAPPRLAYKAYKGETHANPLELLKDVFMGMHPYSDMAEMSGALRTPQTTREEVLHNLSSFVAPGAAGKAKGLQMALKAGVGSEIAGQLTRKILPEYENQARLVGALLGNPAYEGIKKGIVSGKDIVKARNKTALADKLVESKTANELLAKEGYDKVEKGIQDLGISKFKFEKLDPKIKKTLYKKLDPDTVEILKRWEQKPNFENTKDLYSDLGRFDRNRISKLDKSIYGNEAIKSARDLKGNLYETLEKALNSFGDKGKQVFKDLKAADTHYAKKVVPFKNEDILFEKLKSGELTKKEFASAIAKQKAASSKKSSFKNTEIGKEFPELEYVDKVDLKALSKMAKEHGLSGALLALLGNALIGKS